MAFSWYIERKDKTSGPYSGEELKGLAEAGRLLRTDFVHRGDQTKAVSAGKIKGLFVEGEPAARKPGSPLPPQANAVIDPEGRGTRSPFPTEPVEPASPSAEPARLRAAPSAGRPPSQALQVEGHMGGSEETTKAGADLASAQARKAQLARVTIPAAYLALGRVIFAADRSRDEFPDLLSRITATQRERANLGPIRVDQEGSTTTPEMAATRIKLTARARLLASEEESLLRQLGESSYGRYGEQSGPENLVRSIVECHSRLEDLQEEIERLSGVGQGRLITPYEDAPQLTGPDGVLRPLWVGLAIFLCFPLGFYLLTKVPTLAQDKKWWGLGLTWAILGGWVVALYTGVFLLYLLPILIPVWLYVKWKNPTLSLAGLRHDGIRGTLKRVEQSPEWVGLAIFICFPLGLYWLWNHPTLSRRKRWWATGGAWGLIVLLVAPSGDKETKPDSAGGMKIAVNPTPIVPEAIEKQAANEISTSEHATGAGDFAVFPAKPADTELGVDGTRGSAPTERPDALKPLTKIDDFIRIPQGASRLLDEYITRDYYPFLDGKIKVAMYSKDVAWDAENTMRYIYTIIPSSGRLMETTESVDRIVDGKIVSSLPRSELGKSDPPVRYRLQDGFVEIGLPSGGDILWSRKLKTGAKVGDTWEEKTPTHSSRFLVQTVFMLGDKPCASVVERTRGWAGGTGSDTEITTWYVKGKGVVRFENKVIANSGEAVVTTRGELIYPE